MFHRLYGLQGDWVGGEGAKDKSKNLLYGSECVGCDKVVGVLVASFFGPLHRGLDHNLRVSLHVLVSMDAGEL